MRFARPLIGLLFSLILLWVLFQATDLPSLLRSLQSANLWTLAPAVAVYFAGVWLRALRWRMFLAPVADLSTGRLFRATVIGFTVNDLMPVRLGELARVILVTRWSAASPAATFGTIIVERLLDGLTLCAVLAVGMRWIPEGHWLRGAALLGGWVFLGGLGGAMLAAFLPGRLLAIGGLICRPLPDGIREQILRLAASLLRGLVVLRRLRVLAAATLLSAAAWLTEAALYFLLMLGFGIPAGAEFGLDGRLSASLLGMSAANFGTMLPSSPGFVGTFDVVLQAVMTDLFAVERNVATSFTLVVHAALLLPVVVLGLVLLWREGLSLTELRRASGRPPRQLERSTDSSARAL